MSASATQNPPSAPQTPGLPLQADAESPLLHATHLFLAQPESATAGPWARAPDGYEQRPLTLSMRLLDRWKGVLDLPNGAAFALSVTQRRINALMPMEPPDLWSDRALDDRTAMLVIAVSPSHDAATLMREPAARALLTAGEVADVLAAIDGERRMAAAGATAHAANAAATQALLSLANERATGIGAMFASYLWDRLKPAFAADPMVWLQALRPLLMAPSMHMAARVTLLSGLQQAVLEFDPAPDLWRAALRSHFEMLAAPAMAPLHDDLVELYIYNLVFDADDAAVVQARSLFTDGAERQKLAAVLAAHPGERTEQLKRWLLR